MHVPVVAMRLIVKTYKFVLRRKETGQKFLE